MIFHEKQLKLEWKKYWSINIFSLSLILLSLSATVIFSLSWVKTEYRDFNFHQFPFKFFPWNLEHWCLIMKQTKSFHLTFCQWNLFNILKWQLVKFFWCSLNMFWAERLLTAKQSWKLSFDEMELLQHLWDKIRTFPSFFVKVDLFSNYQVLNMFLLFSWNCRLP